MFHCMFHLIMIYVGELIFVLHLQSWVALTSAPFMIVTASATLYVEAQIKAYLHLNKPVVVTQPQNRPTIYLLASRNMGIKVRATIYFYIKVLQYIYFCRGTLVL